MIITYAKENYYNEVEKLWKKCFEDTDAFVKYYFTYKYDENNTLVLSINNEVVAMNHLNQYTLVMNGKKLSVSYIVGVATKQEFRNKGYMRNLIEIAIKEMYKRGQLFSILMPIDSRIYTRFGYEFIQDNLELNIDLTEYGVVHNDSYKINKVDPTNVIDLVDIYKNSTKDLFCYTYRDEAFYKIFYEEMISEGGQIYNFNNQGYIAYYQSDSTIQVREVFYDNIKTLNCIINYLKKTTNRLIINTHKNDVLRLLLPNIESNKITIKNFMMGRIVDFRGFVEQYFIGTDIKIVIKIHDNIINENNNTFSIRSNHLNVEVKQVDKISDIEISIGHITQLMLGYLSIEDLIKMNKIIINNKSITTTLSEIFSKKVSFINEYV